MDNSLLYLPTITFIGHSGSGKTTLIERVIPELKSRGYRVAVAKHVGEYVDLDTTQKDSWRFSRAGADPEIISSGKAISVINSNRNSKNVLTALRHAAGPFCDILIVEGHKKETGAKIEVRRNLDSKPLSDIPDLRAIVSDYPWRDEVPRFLTSDIEAISNFICDSIINAPRQNLAIFLNGKPKRLPVSATNIITDALRLIVPSRPTINKPQRIELWFNLKD